MTARCTGGTSAPNLGTDAIVTYSAGLLASIFAVYDLAWMIPIIPLAGLIPLTLSAFCSSDPPAVPSFTAAEADALLNLTPNADFLTALPKFKDLVLNIIWYDACHCTSGTLIPLTPPAQPSGVPTYEPPKSLKGTPCFTALAVPGTCYAPSSAISPMPAQDGRAGAFSLYFGNVTSVVVTCKNTTCTGAGGNASLVIEWLNASGIDISNTNGPTTAPGATTTFTGTPPAGATDFVIDGIFSGTGTMKFEGSIVDRYCGGELPNLAVRPCPPDLATQALLDLILQTVTLIQRQAAAFGYIASTVHTGLTGAGFINVSGLLGVEVAVTTDSATLGVEGTAPGELFDRGWITFATADGALHSTKLEHVHQLIAPCNAGIYTIVYYDLNPLITISITELVREP